MQICWNGKQLSVEQIPAARNPVFLQGRSAEQFQLSPGGHFVIGNTTFTLSGDRMRVTLDAPKPDREQAFSAAELRRIAFRNANERIEILGRLPDLIKGATNDNELFVRLVNLVLSGVPAPTPRRWWWPTPPRPTRRRECCIGIAGNWPPANFSPAKG